MSADGKASSRLDMWVQCVGEALWTYTASENLAYTRHVLRSYGYIDEDISKALDWLSTEAVLPKKEKP
jgi:hypothetical protein